MKEGSFKIEDVTIVNEGECYQASVLVEDGRIKKVEKLKSVKVESFYPFTSSPFQCFLLPGIIDGHVHMRDPGLTHKATMESETRAAARGGVTTVLDMPNVVPQTTTLQILKERYALADGRCHVNYGFYLGATNDNLEEIKRLDTSVCPGVKIEKFKNPEVEPFTFSPFHLFTSSSVSLHPLIRDHEACYRSTELAVRLAREEGARLHVAHITTAQELDLFEPGSDRITAEACVPHLLFTDKDYETLGARIKCNPAIKTAADREALRKALTDGRIRTIATDHAPHLLSEKEGGVLKAVSGMPMVQFSLPAVLSLVDEGVLSLERAVELMCHNPARLYHIKDRGFIREGYWADFTLVRRKPWTVTQDCIESKCGWSPLEGRTFGWQVEKTWVNGQLVWDGQQVNRQVFGQPVRIENCDQ